MTLAVGVRRQGCQRSVLAESLAPQSRALTMYATTDSVDQASAQYPPALIS